MPFLKTLSFLYFWLGWVLDLHGHVDSSPLAAERGPLPGCGAPASLVAGQGLCVHGLRRLWREGLVTILQKCDCRKEAGLGWENTFLLKRGPYISAGGDTLVKAKKNKKSPKLQLCKQRGLVSFKA